MKINVFRELIELLQKFNSTSHQPVLSFNEMKDLTECIENLEGGNNELKKMVNDHKVFDPNNVEKIKDFFADLWITLADIESNINIIREFNGKLWTNYIPPNSEAAYRYKLWASGIPAEIARQTDSLEPLYYCKIREEIINLDKNILFLISISDGYIVNDEFKGLVVFNKDLSVRKIIQVEGEFILDRRFIYKKFYSDEFIFYYFNFITPEEYFIWYVNITTGEYKQIRYMGELNEFFPQKTYYWKDDLLFLINFTGQFYVIDYHQGVLTEISEEYVQKNHPDFHNYAIDSLYYDVMHAYPQTYSFIFRDKESKEIGLRDSKDDSTKIMKFFDPEVHDIRFHKDYFLFVQEKQIEIRKNKIKRVVIPAPSDYDFYDGIFIEDSGKLFILALAGFYKIPRSNSLILYEIVETVESIELELCD